MLCTVQDVILKVYAKSKSHQTRTIKAVQAVGLELNTLVKPSVAIRLMTMIPKLVKILKDQTNEQISEFFKRSEVQKPIESFNTETTRGDGAVSGERSRATNQSLCTDEPKDGRETVCDRPDAGAEQKRTVITTTEKDTSDVCEFPQFLLNSFELSREDSKRINTESNNIITQSRKIAAIAQCAIGIAGELHEKYVGFDDPRAEKHLYRIEPTTIDVEVS